MIPVSYQPSAKFAPEIRRGVTKGKFQGVTRKRAMAITQTGRDKRAAFHRAAEESRAKFEGKV